MLFWLNCKEIIIEECPEQEHMQPSDIDYNFQHRSRYLMTRNVGCSEQFRVIKEKIKTIQEKLDSSSLEYIFKLKSPCSLRAVLVPPAAVPYHC